MERAQLVGDDQRWMLLEDRVLVSCASGLEVEMVICKVDELVEYAGRFYTLHPGDLIYTGTPSGVGPIRPGDTILATADGLGTMEVRVRDAGLTGSSP